MPENTTLLDILNIAHWTHGLTTSLRQRKSSRLVNAAVENSPIRSSHSYALFFNHLFLPFHRLSLLGMAVGFVFFFKFLKKREMKHVPKHLMKTSLFLLWLEKGYHRE